MGVALHPGELLRLAALARIPLTAEEAERMGAELSSALARLEALLGVELEDIGCAGPPAAPLRADTPAPDPLLRPLEETAPEWREGFFVLPCREGGAP